MKQPLFSMNSSDGSRLDLPMEWEDVFVDYFGEGEKGHALLDERIRFIVSKYVEHRAWPSKFDGITMVASHHARCSLGAGGVMTCET